MESYEESELFWNEAVDRTHVACDHFYEYVEKHPAVQNDKELKAAAGKVTDAIQNFYLLCTEKAYEFDIRSGLYDT